MLSKDNRLQREIFEKVSKSGHRFHSLFFTFQSIESPDGKNRFSAVVSKKVSKTAVGRNRIRRRAYSVLSRLIPFMKNPVHGAFFAKNAVFSATLADTERDIRDLLQKAGITDRMSR